MIVNDTSGVMLQMSGYWPALRWQHGSQKRFAALYSEKSWNCLKLNSHVSYTKNKHGFEILRIKKIEVCQTTFKNNQVLLNKLTTDFTDKKAYYWMKDSQFASL